MVQWDQLSAGTTFPILEETRELAYLEGKWLQMLLQDMQAIRCKIHLICAWTPQPQREYDACIMDKMDQNSLNASIMTNCHQIPSIITA
eukprot:8379675-Ditylum_brightwellii.AAC.1